MKMEQHETELDSYKRQVESLTNEKDHLKCKLKRLKKKLNKLKLKQASLATPLSPLPEAAAVQQQQQNQVMYVPVLAGLLANGEQNVVTTAVSFDTQQGSVSAITSCPVPTNARLLPPPSGCSNI
jgi:regulator of replication initiation timing